MLHELFSALRDITNAQLEQRRAQLERQYQQQQDEQQQHGPPPPPARRRRKRRGGGASGRGSGGSLPPASIIPAADQQPQDLHAHGHTSPAHPHLRPQLLGSSRTSVAPCTCCSSHHWDGEEEEGEEGGDPGVLAVYVQGCNNAEQMVKEAEAVTSPHATWRLTPAPALLDMFGPEAWHVMAGVRGLRHLEMGCRPLDQPEDHAEHTLHGWVGYRG